MKKLYFMGILFLGLFFVNFDRVEAKTVKCEYKDSYFIIHPTTKDVRLYKTDGKYVGKLDFSSSYPIGSGGVGAIITRNESLIEYTYGEKRWGFCPPYAKASSLEEKDINVISIDISNKNYPLKKQPTYSCEYKVNGNNIVLTYSNDSIGEIKGKVNGNSKDVHYNDILNLKKEDAQKYIVNEECSKMKVVFEKQNNKEAIYISSVTSVVTGRLCRQDYVCDNGKKKYHISLDVTSKNGVYNATLKGDYVTIDKKSNEELEKNYNLEKGCPVKMWFYESKVHSTVYFNVAKNGNTGEYQCTPDGDGEGLIQKPEDGGGEIIGEKGCNVLFGTQTLEWLKSAFFFIKLLGAVLAVLLIMFDFIGAVISSDDNPMKKAIKNFKARIISLILLLILPSLLELLLHFVNKSDTFCGLI